MSHRPAEYSGGTSPQPDASPTTGPKPSAGTPAPRAAEGTAAEPRSGGRRRVAGTGRGADPVAHPPADPAVGKRVGRGRRVTGRRPRTRRERTSLVAALVGGAGIFASLVVPVPYVSQEPGPTFDALGEFRDEPMVAIGGARTFPTDGELRLTTVAVLGGPGHRMTAAALLAGWFDPDSVVVPIEQYYPPEASRTDIEQQASMQMRSSQQDAAVAALEEVGIEVPTTLTVSYVSEDSDAHGVVAEGDVLTAIVVDGERRRIGDFADLSQVLAATEPGTAITLVVDRGGDETDLTFDTGSRKERDAAAGLPTDEAPDSSVLGVALVPDAEMPVDVSYQIDDVGGPSAGLMFALATVDKLTPGAMPGGHVVAGTGTMSLDGKVGPIGGIRQKLAGAQEDGAQFFLVPDLNCAEAAGHVPDELRDVRVESLSTARAAVETIGAGDEAAIDALPSCAG